MSKDKKSALEFNLKIPTMIPRILELGEVARLSWDQVENVPLIKAVGRTAAEHITPFPPGIPMTIKGEKLTEEIVEYYLKLKNHPNIHITARDRTMETVWVVK